MDEYNNFYDVKIPWLIPNLHPFSGANHRADYLDEAWAINSHRNNPRIVGAQEEACDVKLARVSGTDDVGTFSRCSGC